MPLFYSRRTDGMPRAWIQRMKASMRHVVAGVLDQPHGGRIRRALLPADGRRCSRGSRQTTSPGPEPGGVEDPRRSTSGAGPRGAASTRRIATATSSASQRPGDQRRPPGVARPQPTSRSRSTTAGRRQSRDCARRASRRCATSKTLGDGRHRYTGDVPCGRSGLIGYTVRIRPHHDDASNLFVTGLMSWA